jgi:nicotinic acid phosphoribosyltransferase
VFSDGLNLQKAFALYRHFADRIMTGFGIGTHLTNDMGLEPLNIVMKLVCLQRPVGGQAVRFARQDRVQRRNLPGLSAPSFPAP